MKKDETFQATIFGTEERVEIALPQNNGKRKTKKSFVKIVDEGKSKQHKEVNKKGGY